VWAQTGHNPTRHQRWHRLEVSETACPHGRPHSTARGTFQKPMSVIAIFRQLPRRSVNSGFAGRRIATYVHALAPLVKNRDIKRAIPKKFWHVFHSQCMVLFPRG
jgi:hypothetical protein